MATGAKRPKRTRIKRTDKKQSEGFIAGAKALGLGASDEDFQKAMDTLARKKPKGGSS